MGDGICDHEDGPIYVAGGVPGDIVRASVADHRACTDGARCGFDAHHRDPLGQIDLQDADYHWITGQICDLATDSCQGRVASILEGGYDLQALATASRAHVKALAS